MKNRNLNHKDNWRTPPDFYNQLDARFHFTFDPCPYDHDIEKWDGLKIEWGTSNFVNPPYSQKLKEAFIKKGIEESEKGKLVVMLLPVSTSTAIFHELILPHATEIQFVKGRINFIGENDLGQLINYPNPTDLKIEVKGEWIPAYIKNTGQHDSMVVVFDRNIQWHSCRMGTFKRTKSR